MPRCSIFNKKHWLEDRLEKINQILLCLCHYHHIILHIPLGNHWCTNSVLYNNTMLTSINVILLSHGNRNYFHIDILKKHFEMNTPHLYPIPNFYESSLREANEFKSNFCHFLQFTWIMKSHGLIIIYQCKSFNWWDSNNSVVTGYIHIQQNYNTSSIQLQQHLKALFLAI